MAEKTMVRENFTAMRIKQLLSEYQWTTYRLAKQANIPVSSINNIFNRNAEPTLTTLRKICEGFNISLVEFFDSDLVCEPQQISLSPDEKELICIYGKLTKSEKECMIAYASGLAHVVSKKS